MQCYNTIHVFCRFREAAAKQTPEGIKAVMTGAASMEEEDNER